MGDEIGIRNDWKYFNNLFAWDFRVHGLEGRLEKGEGIQTPVDPA